MGYFKEIEIDVIELLEYSFLSEEEIAETLNITSEEVMEISEKYFNGDFDCDPGDMDGDAESALASAGFGMDEDYGYAEDVL